MSDKKDSVEKDLEHAKRERHSSAHERMRQRHELQHLYIEKRKEITPPDTKPKKKDKYHTV